MKRLLVILVTLGMIQQADAQIKIRAGLEGGVNSTWLFNKKVSDAGDELDYKATIGGQFGIGAYAKFNKLIGLSLSIMSGSINQKYTERLNVGGVFENSYVTETKLKYIDIPLLFRLTTDGKVGFYFETGPQFSLLSSAKHEDPTFGSADVKSNTNSMNIAAILGFGIDAKAGPITITSGLRMGYGITDAGKKPSYTINYEKTHSAVLGVHLGVAYTFGGAE